LPVIVANGLTKRFGGFTAVSKLNLSINEGEIFGLLGPNGAGKTTTLSMLATLIPPSEGKAYVNGYEVSKQPSEVRHSIGFVFQDPSSDDMLTGRENLYLHALMYGVDMKKANKKIDDVLKLVDLTEKQNIRMKNYSGGMRRRLELARGLLHEPKVLFLDEPTLGLDPQTREHLWKYITKLASEKKVTITITTHYMEEADMLCNRIAIIDHGKIVAMGTPESLKRKLGGDVVRLKVAKPNIAALKRLGYVRNIKVDGGYLTLTVSDAGSHLQEILKKVGSVDGVELRSPTLNDVFLHYTGREIREEAGEGGTFERMMHRGNR
jgi:ABC-2 type transport system ATP-binding protein